MKKLIILLFFSALTLPSFGQNSGFGIRAGLSSAKIDFKSDQFIPQGTNTGYHLGIFARLGGGSFFVQPELLFTQTSGEFRLNLQGLSGAETNRADFNRIDIPVMFGVKMFKLIRLQAGPMASIITDSNLENSVGTVNETNFRQATVGYQAGLGVDIGNLYIDAKYEGGLSKVAGQIAGFDTDNRLNQWILSLGFKIF